MLYMNIVTQKVWSQTFVRCKHIAQTDHKISMFMSKSYGSFDIKDNMCQHESNSLIINNVICDKIIE